MSDTRIADILTTEVEANGAILAQTGDADSQEVFGTETEFWQPQGLASRPSLPSEAGAAQGLCLEGNRDQCLGVRDLRFASIYGAIQDGETCLFATGPEGKGTGRIMMKDDGDTATITLLLQKENTTSGLPIVVQIKSDESFSVAIGDKGALVFDADGFKVGCGSAALEMKNNGEVNLIGTKLNFNGGSIILGGGSPEALALASRIDVNLAAIAASLAQAVNSAMAPVTAYVPSPTASTSVFGSI